MMKQAGHLPGVSFPEADGLLFFHIQILSFEDPQDLLLAADGRDLFHHASHEGV